MHERGEHRLSIVVACADDVQTLDQSLGSIVASCEGLDADVLVVGALSPATAAMVQQAFPAIRLVDAPSGSLAPELWARGIVSSAGRYVALTIGQCIASPGWARTLVRELDAGAAGAGGAFQLAPGASATDRALFLLRYSAFLSGPSDAPRRVADVAGDNAIYRRELLEAHAASWRDGFWELDFHRRLSPSDGELRFVPSAVVGFRPHARLATYLAQRLEHGRHFGRWRVGEQGQAAWRVVAAAPLVPFVLLARIGRRVWSHRAFRRSFAAATPHLLLLAGAWAAGEALGAIGARSITTRVAGAKAIRRPTS